MQKQWRSNLNYLLWFGGLLGLAGCSGERPSAPEGVESMVKAFSEQLPSASEVVKAAARGDVTELQRLHMRGGRLDAGIGNAQDRVTPLMASVISNQIQTMEYLLNQNVPCHSSFKGYTAADIIRFFKDYPAYADLYAAFLTSGKCVL